MSIKSWTSGPLPATMGNPVRGGTGELGFEWTRQTDGPRCGVEMVTLVCGDKRLTVIPTRGMGIWQAEHQGVRFGWNSPIAGPVHPMWVPVNAPDGLGWLEGFDEMLVRCGLASNGAPEFDDRGQLTHPLHGRIANLPAVDVSIDIDESEGRIAIRGTVTETRFHFRRLQLETTIGLARDSPEIELVDRVTNRSDRPDQVQMLYHSNFGSPILAEGARVMAPLRRIVPRNAHAARMIDSWDRFGPPDPACQEAVYFMELAADDAGRSIALLTDATGSHGVSLDYDTATLPCFTLWKNTVGEADGYVTGLEPGTNFPNPHSFEVEHGRVIALDPGEVVDFSLRIGLLVHRKLVIQAIERIGHLQPEFVDIAREPCEDWSADAQGCWEVPHSGGST